MKKETVKQLNEHNDRAAILSSADRFNRARSITTGTCGGGVLEICLRGDDKYLWMPLQPSEVIELIHQLAAGAGCHIHLQPRNDFSSWRKWNEQHPTEGQIPLMQTWPPHANHPPPAIPHNLAIRSEPNEQTVAIEKPKHKRSTKRAATTA